MIIMFLRSEILGINVMFFVFFSMWWRMMRTMELDNGARLQEALGIPS
jgi:hypothetical protein